METLNEKELKGLNYLNTAFLLMGIYYYAKFIPYSL